MLIGFQNDYFVPSGALCGDITDVRAPERTLAATVGPIDRLAATETLVVATPTVVTWPRHHPDRADSTAERWPSLRPS